MMTNEAISARLSRKHRLEQILAFLKLEGAVRIAALADAFGVTTETAAATSTNWRGSVW